MNQMQLPSGFDSMSRQFGVEVAVCGNYDYNLMDGT